MTETLVHGKSIADTVKQLRAAADVWGPDDGGRLYSAAADDIERLVGALAELLRAEREQREVQQQ